MDSCCSVMCYLSSNCEVMRKWYADSSYHYLITLGLHCWAVAGLLCYLGQVIWACCASVSPAAKWRQRLLLMSDLALGSSLQKQLESLCWNSPPVRLQNVIPQIVSKKIVMKNQPYFFESRHEPKVLANTCCLCNMYSVVCEVLLKTCLLPHFLYSHVH